MGCTNKLALMPMLISDSVWVGKEIDQCKKCDEFHPRRIVGILAQLERHQIGRLHIWVTKTSGAMVSWGNWLSSCHVHFFLSFIRKMLRSSLKAWKSRDVELCRRQGVHLWLGGLHLWDWGFPVESTRLYWRKQKYTDGTLCWAACLCH